MQRIDFDNRYARDLPGFYVSWKPVEVRDPRLLFLNRAGRFERVEGPALGIGVSSLSAVGHD